MSFKISNDKLVVLFDEPGAVYKGSRFDWGSQLTQIIWENKHTFCGVETTYNSLNTITGKGLCCEFGIDQPIGFDDCLVGELFPKIGIGMLTRNSIEPYIFSKLYQVLPATFIINPISESVISIICIAGDYRGFSYSLEKRYELINSSILINYQLENTGTKMMTTNEYCHNFISINNLPINQDYKLIFPQIINQDAIIENVNPDKVVNFNENHLTWNNEPASDFFFSGLTGKNEKINSWSIENNKAGVGITESCSFIPDHCNLWGKRHVISPELFFNISIKPGEDVQWQRKYELYKL